MANYTEEWEHAHGHIHDGNEGEAHAKFHATSPAQAQLHSHFVTIGDHKGWDHHPVNESSHHMTHGGRPVPDRESKVSWP